MLKKSNFINNTNWVSKFISNILDELNIEDFYFLGSSYVINEELMIIVFTDKENNYAYSEKMPNSLVDLSNYKNDIKKFLFNLSIDKESFKNDSSDYKYLFFPFLNNIHDTVFDWTYVSGHQNNTPENNINSDKKYKRKKYFYQ